MVVAVNAFIDDSSDELNWVCERAKAAGAEAAAASTHWADGGRGAEELARVVVKVAAQGAADSNICMILPGQSEKDRDHRDDDVWRGGVSFSSSGQRGIKLATRMGFRRPARIVGERRPLTPTMFFLKRAASPRLASYSELRTRA